MTDRRVLEAAASALRRLPPRARAGHLARKLEDMAKRLSLPDKHTGQETAQD
jgi:hypothetical protein